MREVCFVYLICLFVIGRCEIFTWNVSDGESSGRRWEDPSNWIQNNNTNATRSPCRNDTVIFPKKSDTSLIIVSTKVEVLGIKWQEKDIPSNSSLEEL